MAELKTLFVVSIVTARMFFPGFPADNTADGGEKPAPFASASKMLNLDLHSEAPSDSNSKASCAIPDKLKLGEQVDLMIVPAAENTDEPDGPVSGTRPGDIPRPTIKTYWGCSEAVQPGQPKTGSGPDVMESVVLQSDLTDFDPISYAFWPDISARIESDASAVGTYSLTTNYCGNASVEVAEQQDFLLPVEVVGASRKSDLEKPIRIQWKPVPNAVAYLLQAFGGHSGETVVWTSSSRPVAASELERSPISKEDLEKLLADGTLLSSSATSCTIPAGIFKGSDSVMLAITAFGRDTIQVSGPVATHVIVRSTTNLPLYSTPYVPPTEAETPITAEPPPAP